jgi:hypothetical protein
VETRPTASQPVRSAGLLALLIVVFFSGLYLLSYNGTFRVDDEHILAARSQSLALWSQWAEPQVYGNLRVRELEAMGPAATQIEPLQAVLGAGLIRLGDSSGVGGGQAAFTLNLFVTATTAALVFLAVLILQLPLEAALWAAALYGAGTIAWPYATTYFRDPLAALMTTAALIGWILIVQVGTRGRRLAGGVILLVAGFAGVLSKNTAAALVPATGLTILVMAARSGSRARLLGSAVAAGAALVLITSLLPSNGPLARYTLGYLLSVARHFAGSLDLSLLPAVAGPFLSPAKSIFLFSPPLLLVLIYPAAIRRIDWRVALVLVTLPFFIALGQALFYRQQWAGVYGWGLRFMLPALPALIVLAAPAVDRLRTETRRGRWILCVVLAAGIVIQAAGALVPWRRVYTAWEAAGRDPFALSAAWDARFLAIPGQIDGLLHPTTWDSAWIRLVRAGDHAGWWVLLGAAGILLLSAAAALFSRRLQSPLQVGAIAVAAVAMLCVPFLALRPALSDPGVYGDRLEFQAALDWMQPQLRPTDSVVVDAYAMPIWTYFMNRWDSEAHWYSLPFDIPGTEPQPGDPQPSQGTLSLLSKLAGDGGRIWYLTSDEAPDYAVGSEVAWLNTHARSAARRDFSGGSRLEVRLYLPPG